MVFEPNSAPQQNGRLLNTRFSSLASNTIDYWMLMDDDEMDVSRIERAIKSAPVSERSTVQLYLHVPFCAQRCRFCAFSGGNSLDFKQAERFTALLIQQMHALLEQSPVSERWIRAVNIGGGSPDLLGAHIGTLLKAVRDLPGCDDRTELAVEMTLSTTTKEFVDELARYGVTKASFGIQSFDENVRRALRQPASTHHLEPVVRWLAGRVPVINGDLITGLPGQSLQTALRDLDVLFEHPEINGISSYVLTKGAAPALISALDRQVIPALPSAEVHARQRFLTYSAMSRRGWMRRGTNTFYDPELDDALRARLTGNECIGTQSYEDFLIGVGPQAVSSLPGARVENRVDIEGWCQAMERSESPYHLPKCSDSHQRDIALWAFPLRWEGLPRDVFERARSAGAFSDEQLRTLGHYVEEGLVLESASGYELSILGEVFMGHLVRGLKNSAGRQAIDDYIREGEALGEAIAKGSVDDRNEVNNRQLANALLSEGKDGPRT